MRLFVKLDVDFQDDDRLLAVSAEAELMYVRSLAIAKRLGTDGGVTRSHLRRLSDKLTTDVEKLVEELVREGLWETNRRGWVISAWLKHNAPMDAVDETVGVKSAGGRLGNHRRWHRDNERPDICEHCRAATDSESESHTESDSDRSPITDRSPETETETETETEKPLAPARAREGAPASNGQATVDNVVPLPASNSEDDYEIVDMLIRWFLTMLEAHGTKPRVDDRKAKGWRRVFERIGAQNGATPREIWLVIDWIGNNDYWGPRVTAPADLAKSYKKFKSSAEADPRWRPGRIPDAIEAASAVARAGEGTA